jgi:hypothetical protein
VGRELGGGCSGAVAGSALPAGDVGVARRADVAGGHGGLGPWADSDAEPAGEDYM